MTKKRLIYRLYKISLDLLTVGYNSSGFIIPAQSSPNVSIIVANNTSFIGIMIGDPSDEYGAIEIMSPITLEFEGTATFSNNIAQIDGGAIYSNHSLTIAGGAGKISFTGNNANEYIGFGGALYLSGKVIITGSNGEIEFAQNSAYKGGAIYAGDITIQAEGTGDIIFSKNTATNNGGALYCNGAVLELTAQSGNIEFRDNSPNAIYFDNFSQKQLQLKAAQGKHILFDDPIAAQNINAFTTHLNPGNYTGTIHFSTSMELGNVTQYNGILKLSNGATLTAASYIHNAGGASTLALKAGATGSGLASPNSPLTFLSSSIIDVTGTGNKITGKSHVLQNKAIKPIRLRFTRLLEWAYMVAVACL